MDWVMCLLPFAVCFAGVLAAAKVTKKKKAMLAAVGVILFLAAAIGSLAVYRYRNILVPLRKSELLTVAELHLDPLRGENEQNKTQIGGQTALYQEIRRYLERAVYLPCINQDAAAAGTQDIVLQYQDDAGVNLWLAIYQDTGICWVNGKKAVIFPWGSQGRDAYQTLEGILESGGTPLTVTAVDVENDLVLAMQAGEKPYALHKVSEKLWARDGGRLPLAELAVGDRLTVLSDGAVLLSDPYQFEHIYKIYREE